ncbi:MAG TPA: hypothetical protein VH988_23070 [Thermoanaerobaculia bacterium]|nr:hypothetical protein [Thermoanaerobaculia bacterium]
MDDGAVGRSQIRVPEVLIRREEVTAIRETGQGMVVKTADRYRSLLIPRLLDPADYAEIREDLATWVPIESGGGERGKSLALMVLLIGGFVVMGFSHDRGLVAAVALCLIAVYVWTAWRAYRQQGMEPRLPQAGHLRPRLRHPLRGGEVRLPVRLARLKST